MTLFVCFSSFLADGDDAGRRVGRGTRQRHRVWLGGGRCESGVRNRAMPVLACGKKDEGDGDGGAVQGLFLLWMYLGFAVALPTLHPVGMRALGCPLKLRHASYFTCNY